jgi:phosphotransferase system HPr-like phosphotransfer protein
MKLRIKQGDTITISAEGPDEETGLAKLISMVETRFGEK